MEDEYEQHEIVLSHNVGTSDTLRRTTILAVYDPMLPNIGKKLLSITSRDGAGDNDTTDPESTQQQRESTEGEGVFRFGQRGAEQQQQQQGARANRRGTFQFNAFALGDVRPPRQQGEADTGAAESVEGEGANAGGEETTAAAEDINNDNEGSEGGGDEDEGEDNDNAENASNGPEGDDDPAVDPFEWADVMEDDTELQELDKCDDLLFSVYGDTIHRNTGTHLNGGISIPEEAFWKRSYRAIATGRSNLVDLPTGKVTERFILKATAEFKGVRERKWNSERVLVFMAVMLQKEPGRQKYGEIRQLLSQRLDDWEAGRFAMLVRACLDRSKVRRVSHRQDADERVARKFNAQVLAGKVRSAVRQATDRSGGGLLDPFEMDVNTGNPVHQTLRDKHPEIHVPDLNSDDVHCFEDYENVPGMLPLHISDDAMVKVGKRLKGGAGPSGVSSHLLKEMLIRHKRASELFRQEMAAWVDWLANSSPPFAAYRAFMNARLLAGNKKPGVRPIQCGEIFRRYWAKVVILITGFQAMEECGSVQLCAGLPVGVEGAVHAMRRAIPTVDWDDEVPAAEGATDGGGAEGAADRGINGTVLRGVGDTAGNDTDDGMDAEENPGGGSSTQQEFDEEANDNYHDEQTGIGGLLVDADNGFNNMCRYAMLWTIRHLWPRAARFCFNSYRHFAEAFVEASSNEPLVIESQEGIAQGCPLGVFAYGIGMVPLLKRIRDHMYLEEEVVMATYADDVNAAGTAVQSATILQCLIDWGPDYGYHVSVAKSYFICDAKDEAAARRVFESRGLNIQYSRGERVLGGFIGTSAATVDWIQPKVEEWRQAVKILENIAKRYPQTAYYGLAVSLQNEWQHICRTVPHVGEFMGPLEEALCSFLSTLLDVPLGEDGQLRRLLSHKVKQAGMGILIPTESAEVAFATSTAASEMLVNALRQGLDLDIEEHQRTVQQARKKAIKERVRKESEECDRQVENADKREENRIQRAKASGGWLTCVPTHLNGTVLSREEFTDNVRYRNGFEPTNLPEFCDGCGARFTTEHGLNCKKGGLVNERHDDVADEWAYLGSLAFAPSAISHKPMVNEGNPRGRGNGGANNNNNGDAEDAAEPVVEADLEADKGIRNFWKHGSECLFDIRVTNTECRTHRNKDPLKCLEGQEKDKKRKYETACHEQRKHFSPLVYSIDGMAGPMTRAAEKRMASRLAWKWKREYSEMCGYVRCRMSIAVVRSNSLMWRGSRTRRRAHPGFIDSGGAMDAWQTVGEM